MNRREFTAAGLAGMGLAALGGSVASAAGLSESAAGSATEDFRGTVGATSDPASWQIHDASAPSEADLARAARDARFVALLGVTVGSSVAGATVSGVRIDDFGVGVVELGSEGVVLNVFRGESGSGAVASSAGYDVFVRNGGDGAVPTSGVSAVAAAQLASTIAAREGAVSVELVSAREFRSLN